MFIQYRWPESARQRRHCRRERCGTPQRTRRINGCHVFSRLPIWIGEIHAVATWWLRMLFGDLL
jgi:hypothetical protein